MQLGWIDFSKSERDKVLGVLDKLGEQGTLDELGIASIRDGFSDLFFPGVSTLHTHAKYFIAVPLACKELECKGVSTLQKAYEALHAIEQETAKILCENNPKTGIIGSDYINRAKWVKRPPSTLYWAGLRRFGIFSGNCSLNEYLKFICGKKKEDIKALGNRKDSEDSDDDDAGAVGSLRLFPGLEYKEKWKDGLTLCLTKGEAEYLKDKICKSAPQSLLAYVLQNDCKEMLNCNSFATVTAVIKDEKLKSQCQIATDFSNFIHVLWVIYNHIVSDGKSEKAVAELEELEPKLRDFSYIDLDSVIACINKFDLKGSKLLNFLNEAKSAMADGDVDKLKILIKNREINIKSKARAKTARAGEYDISKWFCGDYPDYRLNQAQTIIGEIFEGVEKNV